MSALQPYSPYFPDYIDGAEEALVICIRVPSDRCEHPLLEERYSLCFNEARDILTEALLSYRKQGYTVAGAGACTECESCVAIADDGICKKPGRRIYSLESLGVNVVELARKCFGVELEWSSDGHVADFISTIGAVFPGQDEKRFSYITSLIE